MAMTNRKSHHVVKNISRGWSVKKGGAKRASRTFETQQDAIEYGQKISKTQGTELVIHGRDGRTRNWSVKRVLFPDNLKKGE